MERLKPFVCGGVASIVAEFGQFTILKISYDVNMHFLI